jgi:hypothetical protein
MRVLLALWLLPFGATTCIAAECTREDAYAAEAVVDYLTSWENVHLFYKQFAQCYDGSIAEGVEDRVQQLWATRWGDLPKMVALTKADPGFGDFVLRSLKTESFPLDAFKRVVRSAKARCPPVALDFCSAVRIEAAKQGVSSNMSFDTDAPGRPRVPRFSPLGAGQVRR